MLGSRDTHHPLEEEEPRGLWGRDVSPKDSWNPRIFLSLASRTPSTLEESRRSLLTST